MFAVSAPDAFDVPGDRRATAPRFSHLVKGPQGKWLLSPQRVGIRR
jgi:hypothetical protein